MKKFILAGVMLATSAVAVSALFDRAADAAELKPVQAHSIELGLMKGVAYYTVENDGYRVVATLADTDGGQPVRFVSTLAPGQKVNISVPRAQGALPVSAEIARSGDKVFVTASILTQ